MNIIWSAPLMIPAIALCSRRELSEAEQGEVAGWIAAASLTHRYSGSTETSIDQDLRACRGNDPIGELLTNIRRDMNQIHAVRHDFDGALVDKGAQFAMYVACRHSGMKDLFSQDRMRPKEGLDRHQILPRAQFPKDERYTADCLANVAWVAAGSKRPSAASDPYVFLGRIPPDVLASQCIPDDPTLWRVEKAEQFWKTRQELLAEAFNDYLKNALPGRHVMAGN